MKSFIKKIPVIGSISKTIYQKYINPSKPFSSSQNYWVERYDSGGNSGAGSYGKLVKFKAEILNNFIKEEKIQSILEYGCGDGNQLKQAQYPSYIGFDVSPISISLCKKKFSNDETKSFKLMKNYKGEKSQLTLSLDVIYHLTEDIVFNEYMQRLFESAETFVTIYSSNTNVTQENQAAHVKHRKFSDWIEEKKPEWKLLRYIPNQYPFTGDDKTGSFADFFIYKKA